MLKGSSKIAPEPSSDAAPSTSAPSAAPAAAPAAATKSEQQRAKSKLLQRLDDMHREIEMLRDGAFGASWAEGFNAVAMHHAALSGDPNFVRDLLKDPLHKNCLERRDGAGWLPIHYAACVGLRRVFSLIARATPPPDGAYERVLDDLSKIVAHAVALAPPPPPDDAADADAVAEPPPPIDPADVPGVWMQLRWTAHDFARLKPPLLELDIIHLHASEKAAALKRKGGRLLADASLNVAASAIHAALANDGAADGLIGPRRASSGLPTLPSPWAGALGHITAPPRLRLSGLSAVGLSASANGGGSGLQRFAVFEARVVGSGDDAPPLRTGGTRVAAAPLPTAWSQAALVCELPAPLVLPLRVRLEVSEENAWGEERTVLGSLEVSLPHTPQLKSQKRIGSVAGDIAGAAADGGSGDVRLSFSYEVLNGGALGSFERLKGKALVPPPLPLSPVPGQTPAAADQELFAPELRDGVACVKLLLDAVKRKPRIRIANGRDLVHATAAHKAAAHGDLGVLQLLVAAKADLGARNLYGESPLQRAIENERADAFALLLAAGAPLDSQNLAGDTALHVACARAAVPYADALLEAGAPTDVTNARGWTPLHSAAAGGSVYLLSKLLKMQRSAGLLAEGLIAEESGETVFHAAAGALRLKALRWLLERKPRPKEATGAVVVKNTAHHTAADVLDLVSGELQRLEAAAKAAAGGQSGGAKKPAKPKAGKEGKKAKGGGARYLTVSLAGAHARLQLGKSKKFPSVVAAEEGRWLRKEQQASEKLIAAELKKQRAAFGGGKKKGAMKYKA